MRYIVFMVLVFAAYFWAMNNIGEKYVEKHEIVLPAEPDKSITDLHEGKYPLRSIQRKQEGEPQPTVHVVDY